MAEGICYICGSRLINALPYARRQDYTSITVDTYEVKAHLDCAKNYQDDCAFENLTARCVTNRFGLNLEERQNDYE